MTTDIRSFEQLPDRIETSEALASPRDFTKVKGALAGFLCAAALMGGLKVISLATNSPDKSPTQHEHIGAIPFDESGDFYPPLGSNRP